MPPLQAHWYKTTDTTTPETMSYFQMWINAGENYFGFRCLTAFCEGHEWSFTELKRNTRDLSKHDISDLGYIAFKLRTFLTAEEL